MRSSNLVPDLTRLSDRPIEGVDRRNPVGMQIARLDDDVRTRAAVHERTVEARVHAYVHEDATRCENASDLAEDCSILRHVGVHHDRRNR